MAVRVGVCRQQLWAALKKEAGGRDGRGGYRMKGIGRFYRYAARENWEVEAGRSVDM